MFDRGSPVTVRELTLYIKRLLENDSRLSSVWVKGEISNFKLHTSGHMYFTLKDESSQLKCVMFRSAAQRLRFRPDNGMQVLLWGSVQVYDRDGAYQLYAQEMEPAGLGALHLQYEQLKRKLEAEGLFDPARKRRPPMLPRRIGIVTATTGAALRDMITISRRRFPAVRLLISPALVQGAEAPASLIRALQLVAAEPEVDVIIIGRGGGSLEDLWAFNDEALARAIRACPVPVVSAVGHETDFTIADFAADLRAPTPSAAAELVVPSRLDLLGSVESLRLRLVSVTRRLLERKRLKLRALAERPVLQRPQGRLLQDRQRLDDLVRRLGFAGGRRIERCRQRLGALAGRLDALSPLAVLSRGYAIARDAEGGVIKDARSVAVDDAVSIMLHKGTLQCRVESKTEES
ncbi:MAG TPA: exodeoxyribonuclease VII large subunit [Symbiobacteriaceae bacterium]|nr:exodeoxyribonuclease VII large subunit [Symbiobacteriaceae bacterium]